MSALLEVQGLTAGYRRPVIREISFALRPGEITAVLGRNGCGKTTLLRSLTGGARILSGTVWAAGEDCLDWSARRRARSIALLSQHSQLLPAQRGEQLGHLRQHGGHTLLAVVSDAGVAHQAASASA